MLCESEQVMLLGTSAADLNDLSYSLFLVFSFRLEVILDLWPLIRSDMQVNDMTDRISDWSYMTSFLFSY